MATCMTCPAPLRDGDVKNGTKRCKQCRMKRPGRLYPPTSIRGPSAQHVIALGWPKPVDLLSWWAGLPPEGFTLGQAEAGRMSAQFRPGGVKS